MNVSKLSAGHPSLNWKKGKNGMFYQERSDALFQPCEKAIEEARYGWVVNGLKRRGCRTVIDIGCGLGYGTYLISKEGFRVKGIDYSYDAIKIARKRYSFIEFEVADACCYQEGKYDAVVALEILEHLPNPKNALKNWRQMLNKKGFLFISTPNYTITKNRNPHHKKEFTLRELKGMFPKARIRGLNCKILSFFPVDLLLRIFQLDYFIPDYMTIEYKLDYFLSSFFPSLCQYILLEVSA